MIISEKKLLFIHIPKTGGQSLTEYFLKNLLKKPKIDKFGVVDIDSNPEFGLRLNMGRKLPGPQFYHHLFLSEYLENKLVPANTIDEYYKFTVIRNPYDRFVSAYNFLGLSKEYKAYYDFAKTIPYLFDKNSKLYRMFCTQCEYLDPVNKINKIFTTEKIDEAFDFLKQAYGFNGKVVHRNKSQKIKRKPLDSKTVDFIDQFYKTDIELYQRTKLNCEEKN